MCLSVVCGDSQQEEIIVSDNAKTFKSAAKVLKKVFSYPSVKRFLANRRISWMLNMDIAPWWSGLFERLIHNAKQWFADGTEECQA